MRQIVKILLATAVAATGAVIQPDWPEHGEVWARSLFMSAERDFSIVFPRAPRITRRGAESDDASGYRTYSAEAGHAAFLVRVDQYPRTILVPAPDTKTYQLILRAHAVESSSRLTSTTPLKLSGRLALQGIFAYATGAKEIRRVLMVGHRIYQVSYTEPHGAALAAGSAFLESFRVMHND